jgi:hypothetical protein
MVIAWLVVGFNAAIKVTNKWFKDEGLYDFLSKPTGVLFNYYE